MFDPPTMDDSERLSRLRHDLSNPLSALLAETQLLLLNETQIDPEVVTSLREIEALAIRMRTMLRETWVAQTAHGEAQHTPPIRHLLPLGSVRVWVSS